MNSSLYRFTFFLLFVSLFFSCTKITTTDIGAGLIPPVDGVSTKDTVLDVLTTNTDYDTVSVGISDNHVLGYIDDNIFGTTTASVNFQVAPPILPFSWGILKDNIVLDSVVLCLKYQSTWGDTNQLIKLHVYNMDPEVIFNGDSAYNNTKTFEKGTELTEFNTAKSIDIRTLNDVDTTNYYREIATSQIRIRLNNSFGQQLINYDSATVYQSDSTFNNSLRGLIVEPDATGKALVSISLTDTSTHLSVYYHSVDKADTLTRRFSPNVLTSASSNTILRNYQGTQIPSYVAKTATNQDFIFMQTSPGIYATIKTPGVDSLSNRIVHRAELLMYQVPDAGGDDQYLTPPNLFLAAYNTDSVPNRRMTIPNDIIFSGSSISNITQFGVLPIPGSSGSTAYHYSFDVTRYLQGIITKKEKVYNLILYAPYNQYVYLSTLPTFSFPIATPSLNTAGVGRVMLGGGSNPQYKMRLHIVYSLVQ